MTLTDEQIRDRSRWLAKTLLNMDMVFFDDEWYLDGELVKTWKPDIRLGQAFLLLLRWEAAGRYRSYRMASDWVELLVTACPVARASIQDASLDGIAEAVCAVLACYAGWKPQEDTTDGS